MNNEIIVNKLLEMIVLSLLLFSITGVQAATTLEAGFLFTDRSTIIQTEGDIDNYCYSENNIFGEDYESYQHSFSIKLNLTIVGKDILIISFNFTGEIDQYSTTGFGIGFNGENPIEPNWELPNPSQTPNFYFIIKRFTNNLDPFNIEISLSLEITSSRPLDVISGFQTFAVIFENGTIYQKAINNFQIHPEYISVNYNNGAMLSVTQIIGGLIALPLIKKYKHKNKLG